MIGRKEKGYMPLWRPIEVQNENGNRFLLGKIQVCCPVCGSPEVGTYGTHGRKGTRLEVFNVRILNARTKKASKHLNSLY